MGFVPSLSYSITRPKGRVRIETSCSRPRDGHLPASPGRKAGCGLKPDDGVAAVVAVKRITRPKGRVRIETSAIICWPQPLRRHHPAERPGAD